MCVLNDISNSIDVVTNAFHANGIVCVFVVVVIVIALVSFGNERHVTKFMEIRRTDAMMFKRIHKQIHDVCEHERGINTAN